MVKDVQRHNVCTDTIIRKRMSEPAKPRVYASDKDCYRIGDSVSFLEYIRAYQLADILGKYKLF